MTDAPFPSGSELRAYLRDSGGHRQHLSVPQQEAEITAWCAGNGYRLTHVYKDVARTSKNGTVGREAFAEMQQYFDAGKRPESGLLLWDLTRWAREVRSGLRTFLDLEAMGVRVYPISEPLPEGRFGLVFVLLKLMSAEDENKRKSTDVQRGLRRLVQDHHGLHTGASLPFGYRKTPAEIGTHYDGQPHVISRIEPDPATAPLIRRGFEMAAAGHSLGEILHAIGLYRDISGIASMLANPVYIGERRSASGSVSGWCEPLVERDLWDRAQQARQAALERSGWSHPRSVQSAYLLSGMVNCGMCGGGMWGQADNRRGVLRYYACKNLPSRRTTGTCATARVDANHLEAAVLAKLLQALEHPGLLAALHAQQIQARPVDDHQARIDGKRAELADLDRQIGRIVAALAVRDDSQALIGKLTDLEAAQAKTRADLATLEASRPPAPLDLATLESLRRALLARLDGGDFRTQQLTLRSVNCRVSVSRTGRRAAEYSGTVTYNLGVLLSANLP